MSSMAIGAVVFACTFGGALAGMLLRAAVPDRHLTSESKEVVKLGTGLIATLTGLVLALLIASAKSSFDVQRTGMQQLAANFVVLDRALAKVGPEAGTARESLRRLVQGFYDRLSQQNRPTHSALAAGEATQQGGIVYDQIRALVPKNESQRWLQSQAIQLAADFAKTRWLLTEQQDSAIPIPFLVIVIFWLTTLFVSFGLFSPPNPIATTTLLICALSVGGAVFLIVDLDQTFGGVIHVSAAPLKHALSQLGK